MRPTAGFKRSCDRLSAKEFRKVLWPGAIARPRAQAHFANATEFKQTVSAKDHRYYRAFLLQIWVL